MGLIADQRGFGLIISGANVKTPVYRSKQRIVRISPERLLLYKGFDWGIGHSF